MLGGSTFGERSLMRAKTTGQCVSEVNVDAGADGLSCLTFDGELIYDIFNSASARTRLHVMLSSYPYIT